MVQVHKRQNKSTLPLHSTFEHSTSMDSNMFTMLFRYQTHVAVKVSYPNLKFVALVDFVSHKWNFMEGRAMRFTYNIDQVGDCYLTEDEDIPAMFTMLRRYGMFRLSFKMVQVDSRNR